MKTKTNSGTGKKDMDYLGMATTKELPENPDHDDIGKKKKSVKVMIAILKARKSK
jgi:hypothetical protein